MKFICRKFKVLKNADLYGSSINKFKANSVFHKLSASFSSPIIPMANSFYTSKRFMTNSCDGGNKNKISGRHQFHKDTENKLNEQVLEEFKAAYEYLTIGHYFGRTDVALPGCQGFFMNMYEEELGHANIFTNYVLMRGGHVNLKSIPVPEIKTWTVTEAFSRAVQMEQGIKEKLNEVFDVAEKHKDLHIMDLVSTEFMEEQHRSICEIARLVTRSKITDTKVGEYLFDQMIFESFVKKEKENLMNERRLQLVEGDDKHGIYK
ncbi:soma ferritin-like [Diabrotica virgifera virgifera]|uniref:Ferritin n=1 Tax=Diabrotica virgifera virgifera TaxID=50390 RepID=A0A6P7G6H8_DIAVI|nr:soma ferritin-like [Diabrotica virgifera virgifera]